MRPGLLALAIALGLTASVAAQQQASILGSVVDESKAVVPGVSITATEISSGRQYVAVSDQHGEYRLLNLDPGRYKLQAEISGFASVVVPQLELLVGQNATLPFVLKVATLEESLTVTGESLLVDTTSSQVAGNIDRRQMEELPLQGRNWQELSLLVKGITANNVAERPGVGRDDQFQLNLDGQQIKESVGGSGFGQRKISGE